MDSSDTKKSASRRLSRANWPSLLLFLLIAASLLGSIVLIYQTVEAERRQRAQFERTSEILLTLRNVSRAAINGETGQRGYLITLDRRYLTPYKVGSESYRPALERLDALLGANRTQRQTELYDQIKEEAEARFAELDASVELVARGELRDAQLAVLTDDGQESMANLRSHIREMERIENRILADAAGQTSLAEARVLPLLGGLFLFILFALVAGFIQTARAARADAEAANAAALGEARDRADLLARELNHRVKNIFSVILAIVRMSGRDKPEAQPVVESIADRIHALLTAHEVTQGSTDKPVADLTTLVETTFAPYNSEDRTYELNGQAVRLPAKQVTPLGLVLHELTTNAVKYGAWASGGKVEVKWQISDGQLTIDWREYCHAPCEPSEREGFGSLLMTGAARQLRGTIDRTFAADGAVVRISLPLSE